MAEKGWIPSEVTQAHLQDLLSQGFMMATELATCRMPEEPVSPVPVGDTWWPAQHSMREGSVGHPTDSFALGCSSMV
jgi:hypothetical protein